MSKALGKLIRQLRQDKGLTLGELSSKADITIPHLSEVELGHRNASEAVLRRIADILGVPFQRLSEQDSRVYLKELKEILEEVPSAGPQLVTLGRELADAHRRASAARRHGPAGGR